MMGTLAALIWLLFCKWQLQKICLHSALTVLKVLPWLCRCGQADTLKSLQSAFARHMIQIISEAAKNLARYRCVILLALTSHE